MAEYTCSRCGHESDSYGAHIQHKENEGHFDCTCGREFNSLSALAQHLDNSDAHYESD